MVKIPIRKFSVTNKLISLTELKEFRNYVSQLKKQGVITSKRSARLARPSNIVNGKTLAELVNKHSSDLKRFKPAVRVAPVLPSLPKLKKLPLNRPVSIRNFPHKGKSLAEFFRQIEKDPAYAASLDAMKDPRDKWGFEMSDELGIPTRSVTLFPNLEMMADQSFRGSGGADHADIFDSATNSRKLYGMIRLVRWNGTVTEWRGKAKADTVKRRAKWKAQHPLLTPDEMKMIKERRKKMNKMFKKGKKKK